MFNKEGSLHFSILFLEQIIFLLILAVVAISAVQEEGIIKHAINAQSAYNAEKAKEEQELQNYLNYINEHITGQGSSENGGTEEQPQEPEDGGTEVEPPVPQEPTVAVSGDANNDGKINHNETWTLTLKDAQENAISGVSFSSSDTSIATVNSNGVITGVSHGTATITATYTENGQTKTKEYDVNMVEYVEEIRFFMQDIGVLEVGDTFILLRPRTSPTEIPKGIFSYSSSDTSVATIDKNGVVTAVGPGTFKITVTYTPPQGSDGSIIIRETDIDYYVLGLIEPPDEV